MQLTSKGNHTGLLVYLRGGTYPTQKFDGTYTIRRDNHAKQKIYKGSQSSKGTDLDICKTSTDAELATPLDYIVTFQAVSYRLHAMQFSGIDS